MILVFIVFSSPLQSVWAEQIDKRIAITLDDLPFVGDDPNFHLNRIIDIVEQFHVPMTGFIIGDRASKSSWSVLERFRNAGLGLGNHTMTHISLNQVSAETYIDNIAQADQRLGTLLTKPKYFRYPYLAMGAGAKKERVLAYLTQNDYHVAPVTIDSKDFMFNQQLLAVPELERRDFLNELRPVYLDYILLQTLNAEQFNQANKIPNRAQILLIHANLLNAYLLNDIITLYRNLGYRIISLEEALSTFSATSSFRYASISAIQPATKRTIASNDLSNAPIDSDLESDAFMAWD